MKVHEDYINTQDGLVFLKGFEILVYTILK